MPLANTLYVPHNEKEYDRLVALLDDLIDEVGEDETQPFGFHDGGCRRPDRKIRG
jgi:HTH-type transcriptional regulator/antitoxin HigA